MGAGRVTAGWDMDIQVHAVVLLVLPLATLAWCLRWRGRPVPAKRAAVGVAVAVLTMLAAIVVNTHACNEGLPPTQWLIGGICVGCVIALTPAAHWRWALGGVLIVVTQVLALHFTDVVHRSGWTGNPRWAGVGPAMLATTRRQIERLAQQTNSDVVYPAGWLHDIDLPAPVDQSAAASIPAAPGRRVVSQAWHTWLTGLYAYATVPQDYWFPGGNLSRAAARIELRERPTATQGS